ncbi:UPF0481-like protein [Cinnamomum micranthum f. kanehirae]|uniref:UPF0481-like protein n=1 Tax=Cinnamomum micranthum f. kanehirae TaxID=337451 RepID=A0A443NDN6_9MAGN|nr:UPF0481-like protein [Cinnamomum micranthum f. kanehirae]
MAGETSEERIIPLHEEHEDRGWLVEIIEEQQRRSIKITGEQEQPRSSKPRIQKVDGTLRQIQSNNEHFEPKVVALGPYNWGNDQEHLKPMERYKNIAAGWFISLATNKKEDNVTEVDANKVYDDFIIKATSESSPIQCYADPKSIRDRFGGETFMRRMFLDGCFILHFIHLVVVQGWPDHLSKSGLRLNQQDIVRDMFLLENQIPFSILNALMKIPSNPFDKPFDPDFILIWNLDYEGIFSSNTHNRHHLLDVLHYNLVGRDRASFSSSRRSDWYCDFSRPIMELKATGIQVRRSNSMKLRDVKFKRGLLYSYLEIPAIIVDDSTKTRLLNMIAYEMCSDGPKHRTVTSYVCYLHSLIHNVDDVKELQSENILLNHLGSEEDAVKLFKELGTLLSPDYGPYGTVIDAIYDHYMRRFSHLLKKDNKKSEPMDKRSTKSREGEPSVRLHIDEQMSSPKQRSDNWDSIMFEPQREINDTGGKNDSNTNSGSSERHTDYAPEKKLTIFALRLAILEKSASGLGTLGFIWATVITV